MVKILVVIQRQENVCASQASQGSLVGQTVHQTDLALAVYIPANARMEPSVIAYQVPVHVPTVGLEPNAKLHKYQLDQDEVMSHGL